MTDDYHNWLDRYDISRPHRTGRWRVRLCDIQTCQIARIISVGGSRIDSPTDSDYQHFFRWRDSDERRHKSNAAGFLRFAGYRHLIDGNGRKQTARAKDMCASIRTAMTAFANGDVAAGESAMALAYGEYMWLLTLSTSGLVHKGARFAPGRRRGAKSLFTAAVEDAYRLSDSKDWKSVIRALESQPGVQELDWQDETIWLAGEDEPRTFKTARNIISKLQPKFPTYAKSG